MGPRIFQQIVPEFYEQKSDFKKDKKKIILIFSFKKLDFLVLEERGGRRRSLSMFLFREKYYSYVFGVKCLHFCAELDRDNLKFLCHIPHSSDCHLDSVATCVKFSRSLNKTE